MSEKINELIINAREHLQAGEKETHQSLRNIQYQIDDKNVEIRSIFARNLDSVIQNFIHYQQTITRQKKLQALCEDFGKRINKSQSLNEYDEQMIERGEKAIEALKKKKQELETYKDSIAKLKKIVMNISQERYNNAIKILNLYRASEPTLDTPLKKCLPIIMNKIHKHMIKLVTNFWETNNARMLEIGTLCFNKLEMSTNQKTNIYQAFFGRNSSTNRNSLIRKSSVVTSMIEDGRSQAPLRFLKKVNDCEVLQRYTLRLNVEMNNIKQMKIMCKQLNEDDTFIEIINKENRKMVSKIMEECPCEYQSDLKKLLSHYIGFLLFRRQVLAYFRIDGDNKILLGQVYDSIGQQSRMILSQPQNLYQVMKIKDNLDLFHKVLQIVDIDAKKNQYSKILGDIFRIYCKFSLQRYQAIIMEQINQDNLTAYHSEDKAQQKDLQNILYVCPNSQNNYNFTSFVIYVVQILNQYYDRMIAFVKDSDLNKSQLHEHLSTLFERIIAIYGGDLLLKDQPLQIAQGQINLKSCEKAFKYFSEELENKHQYIRICQVTYKKKLDKMIVDLRTKIRENVENKIAMMMMSYELEPIWLPDQINKQPHDFMQWMLEFIREIIKFMRTSGSQSDEEMIYAWMGHICHLYWDYFENCTQFTLATIYNLQMDLLLIYKYINSNFNFYPNLSDKFKSLQQFYSLMLTSNFQDLLDRQKREISFSSLDMHQILPILHKYSKGKNNGNGKWRELKKKQVESIVKKLQNDFK